MTMYARILAIAACGVVTALSASAQIRITSPVAAAMLHPGDTTEITWQGISRWDRVEISYRREPSDAWTVVTDSASELRYAWAIPASIPPAAYELRIRRVEPRGDDGSDLVVLGHGHGTTTGPVIVSHDGGRVYSVSADAVLREHDVHSHRVLREFPGFLRTTQFALSKDDRLVVGAAERDLWIVDLQRGEPSQMTFPTPVTEVLLSPTADRGIVRDHATTVWLVDLGARRILQTWNHPKAVNDVAVSADWTRVATACADKLVRVFEVDGSDIDLLGGHDLQATAVCFSPDGTTLLTCGHDPVIRVWDVASGVQVDSMSIPEHAWSIAYDPSEQWIVAASRDNGIYVYDASTRQRLGMLGPLEGDARWLHFHPTLPLVMGSTQTADTRIWDLTTMQQVIRFENIGGYVYGFDFLQGRRCITASGDHRLRWHDLEQGSVMAVVVGPDQVGGGYQGRTLCSAFSRDGRHAIAGYEDGHVWFWNVADGTLAHRSETVPYPVVDLDVHPANGTVAQLLPFEVRKLSATAATLASYPSPLQRTLGKVRYAPTGSLLAVLPDRGYSDSTIVVLDEATFTERLSIARRNEVPSDAQFTMDGRWLVTVASRTIRVWDMQSGALHRTFTHMPNDFSAIHMSADGSMCVIHGGGPMAWIYDVATWSIRDSITAPANLRAAAISPDNRRLALMSGFGIVSIHDLSTREAIDTIEVDFHTASTNVVRWSPDGSRLAIGRANAYVVDTETWSFTGIHDTRASLHDLFWSPDGSKLLLQRFTHQSNVWDLAPTPVVVEGYVSGLRIGLTSVHTEADVRCVVSPQPAHDRLHVRIASAAARLRLMDAMGRTMHTWDMVGSDADLDVRHVPSGLYGLEVQAGSALYRTMVLID